MTKEQALREYAEATRSLIGATSERYNGKAVRARVREGGQESFVQVWVGGWHENEYHLHALLPPESTRNPSGSKYVYAVIDLARTTSADPTDVVATGAEAFWAFDRFHVRLFPSRPDLRVKVQEVFE